MIDCKRLESFFREKAEEYLRYFEHFSRKKLFKIAARCHFKHLKLKRFGYIQQKVAVALSIALGRNPANLTYLRETDFINLTSDSDEPCYVLKMPRIKKRQLNPRDDFMEEYLDPEFATYIQELIAENQQIKTIVKTKNGDIEVDKPLFIKVDQNKSVLSAGLLNESFNMPSAEISELVKQFAKRH